MARRLGNPHVIASAALVQVVIPVASKNSPLLWNSPFDTKVNAERWLTTQEGQEFISATRRQLRIPALNNIKG